MTGRSPDQPPDDRDAWIAIERGTRPDPARWGGKASSIVRLGAAGLPVLPAIVVPTGAPAVQTWSRGAREAFVAAVAALGPRLAVRSSAPEEDGATHSWAGQHLTVLDVAPDEAPDAVAAVVASAHADRARAYGGDTEAMAVLIQPMVDAASAGVAFTVDPTSGERVGVVEAVAGLGDALVDGTTTPWTWRVAPASWRRRCHVRETMPGEGAAPLSDDEVVAVAELARRAADVLDGPADVEWAHARDGHLVLLQARPITATAAPRTRDAAWTRRFLGERWPDPATPMGWSLVRPHLDAVAHHPRTHARLLGGRPTFTLRDGRPHVDGALFSLLAFKVPGLPAPAFLLEMLDPDEAEAWRHRRAGLPDLELVAVLAAETVADRWWRKVAWNPLDNVARWRRWEGDLLRDLRHLRHPPADVATAIARVETTSARLGEYVGIHVMSLLYAHVGWNAVARVAERAFPGEGAALRDALLATPAANPTLRTNADLTELARLADDADLRALEAGTAPSPAFAGALRAFLLRHGHRADGSWEVFATRWADDPARLVPLLRVARRGAHAAEAQAATRAHADAVARVRRGPVALGTALLALTWWTRRSLLLRETQRYRFDALTRVMRDAVDVLGDGLATRGDLDAAKDVRFLPWPTARDAWTSPPADLAEQARAARAQWAAWCATPVVSGSDGAAQRRGRGVSAGLAEGRVRRLARPSDADDLAPGDVLVVEALDPTWTPLLRVAGACVCELGGALSHGAVVAREYGVPMVVDLAGARAWLRDGERVRVDGRRGRVWRLEPPEPPAGSPS